MNPIYPIRFGFYSLQGLERFAGKTLDWSLVHQDFIFRIKPMLTPENHGNSTRKVVTPSQELLAE